MVKGYAGRGRSVQKSFPCPSSASSRSFGDSRSSPDIVVSLSYSSFNCHSCPPSYQQSAIPQRVKRLGLSLSLAFNLPLSDLDLLKSLAFSPLSASTSAHTFVGNSKSSTEPPYSSSSNVMVRPVLYDEINCAASFSSARYSRRYDSIEYQLSHLSVLSAFALGRELLLLTDRMMSWMLSIMRFSSLAINT